jgi:alpha-L-arabinofuranosidase
MASISALYAARLMNVFERKGDLVTMSAVSDLINGWPGGIIQASRHGVFETPIYLVNALYARRTGTQRLASMIDSPTFDSSREGRGVPYLDAVVNRSADGKQIFIKAVNTDLARPLSVKIRIVGAAIAPQADMEAIVANSLTATNGFGRGDVAVRRRQIDAGTDFMIELPKHSATVITLKVIA